MIDTAVAEVSPLTPVTPEVPLTPAQKLDQLLERGQELGQRAINDGLNKLTLEESTELKDFRELAKLGVFGPGPVDQRYATLEAFKAKKSQLPELTESERQQLVAEYHELTTKPPNVGLTQQELVRRKILDGLVRNGLLRDRTSAEKIAA